jgi:iron-sulfur cluster assembly protein
MSLTLTPNAVAAVKGIVSAARDAPATTGVRIVSGSGSDATTFHLSVAAAPATGDEVIEENGARIFVEGDAAALLQEKKLDAFFRDENDVAFVIVTDAA